MAVETQVGAAVPERVNDVAAMVRTLGALYNTSLTYGPNHPVVARVIREQLPLIEGCLRDLKEIRLFFLNGLVRYGTTPLEPGNSLFQRLSQVFSDKHVSGIIIVAGVTADEIRKLVQILVKPGDDVAERGLQALLEQEGVRSIRESQQKIGLINTAAAAAVGGAGGSGNSGGGSGTGSAAPAAGSAAKIKGNVWDLSGDLPDLYEDVPVKAAVPTASAGQVAAGVGQSDGGAGGGGGNATLGEAPPFREFVHDVVVDVNLGRSSPAAASEKITVEFEKRIQDRTEEVERRSATRIRSLENVRDVMLTEMETLRMPAVLVDHELHLLGANASGRALVGRSSQVLPGSALHRFLSSEREREAVDLPGGRRVAHKVLAIGADKESSVTLITLE
jgi:hypothetical protein